MHIISDRQSNPILTTQKHEDVTRITELQQYKIGCLPDLYYIKLEFDN